MSMPHYSLEVAVRVSPLGRLPRNITFPPPFPKRDDSMSAARHPRFQRPTTAAALKQQILDFLGDALPACWVKQPLVEAGAPAAAALLIISPRGQDRKSVV